MYTWPEMFTLSIPPFTGDTGTTCSAAGGHYEGVTSEGQIHGKPTDSKRYEFHK